MFLHLERSGMLHSNNMRMVNSDPSPLVTKYGFKQVQ